MKLSIQIALFMIAMHSVGFGQKRSDADVYNKMVTIKGHVTIKTSDGTEAIGGGQYLVFQKVACNSCLIATHADRDGNYKIRVGRGRYKVIVFNPSPPVYDLMSKQHSRFVTATSPIEDKVFDIWLVAEQLKKK